MFMGIVMVSGGAYLYARMKKFEKRADNLDNLEQNNYASDPFVLKRLLQRDSSLQALLEKNGIKKSTVESVTKITHHETFNIKDTLINDTLRCIKFNEKGIKIDGCNGEYVMTNNMSVYAVANEIRQNRKTGKTKTGPLKFLFHRTIEANAWTEFGDTLTVKIVEK